MVLPVNWRSNLSFEDGGPMKEGDEDHGDFSLQDITPASIPAVRSLISDVMLDIPFYSRWYPRFIYPTGLLHVLCRFIILAERLTGHESPLSLSS